MSAPAPLHPTGTPGTPDAGRPRHLAAQSDEDLLAQCHVGKTRSTGPGGQHRNKVETKIVLTHEPTGLQAQAGERRSAEENKRVATFRLRLLLALRVRTAVPIGDVRSDLWRTRCQGGRIACSPTHRDFPSMLAEALDMIEACGLDEKRAATRLCCSTSQLIKLVKDHPPAFEHWNKSRAQRDEHPLH